MKVIKAVSKFLCTSFFIGALFFFPTAANATTTVDLTIRYQDTIVYDETVTLATTTYHDTINDTDYPLLNNTVFSALVLADQGSDAFSVTDTQYYDAFSSFFIRCLTIASGEQCDNWQYVVDGIYPSVGMDSFALSGDEQINLYFGDRYTISTNETEFYTTDTVTTTLEEYDFENNVWVPSSNSQLIATDPILPDYSNFPPTTHATQTTDANGVAPFSFFTTGTYYLTLNDGNYWPGVTVTVTSTPEENSSETLETSTTFTTSTITIRYQDTIIFDDAVTLATTTHTDIINNIDYPLTGTSTAFSALVLADLASESFSITDAQYNDWYASFFVNCLTIETPTTTVACGQWQYVVDGLYPSIGMDAFELSGGENVYFYFGDRYDLAVSTTTVEINATVTSTLQEYDFVNNLWLPASDTQLLATEPIALNYSNYPPATLSSSTTDVNGDALFTFSATGTYYITLDSYWPGVTIIVTSTDEIVEESIEEDSTSSGGGGCSLCGVPAESFDVTKAISFLNELQKVDGSFGESPFYADWVAIAFGANSTSNTELETYLKTNPDEQSGPNTSANYARRAMALMALNINPYDGTGKDFITLLINTFDGTQFGNSGLINDDIFALFPLLHAGYTVNDKEITSTVSYLLAQQSSDGSFGDVDLTSAAVQALSLVTSLADVPNALTEAKTYLQSVQASDGGFGNIDSTSWALQAIGALNESHSSWAQGLQTPLSYLRDQQQSDGGVRDLSDTANNRIWSTAYSIPAGLSKSWGNILHSFSRPTFDNTTPVGNGGSGFSLTPTIDTITTSTPETTTTTTIDIATSTPTIVEEVVIPTSTELLSLEGEIITQLPKEVLEIPTPSRSIAVRTPNHNVTQTIGGGVEEPIAPTTEAEQAPTSSLNEIIQTTETLTPNTGSTPLQKTAKGVFGGALGLTGTLGAYLGWRLIQSLA